MSYRQHFLTLCAAVIGGCLAYVACDFGGWPRLTYDPHAHTWRFVEGVVTGAPMPYLGMVLWGLTGFVVSGAIAAVWFRRSARVPADSTLRLAAAWSVTAFGGAAAYYLWNLWPF